MIISKSTKRELLEIFKGFGVKQSCAMQFIANNQNKLAVTGEAFEEMTLEELKAVKKLVQFSIHEREGVAV